MHIPSFFSSSILHQNVNRFSADYYGQLVQHFQNAPHALRHHLERVVPHGGTVCVIQPGPILNELLPRIAQEKQTEIITGPDGPADLYLTEPDGLTFGGGLAKPDQASAMEQHPCVAIGSVLQWTKERPASHDFVRFEKIITEFGVYTPEHLALELNGASSFSLPSSLLSSLLSSS